MLVFENIDDILKSKHEKDVYNELRKNFSSEEIEELKKHVENGSLTYNEINKHKDNKKYLKILVDVNNKIDKDFVRKELSKRGLDYTELRNFYNNNELLSLVNSYNNLEKIGLTPKDLDDAEKTDYEIFSNLYTLPNGRKIVVSPNGTVRDISGK